MFMECFLRAEQYVTALATKCNLKIILLCSKDDCGLIIFPLQRWFKLLKSRMSSRKGKVIRSGGFIFILWASSFLGRIISFSFKINLFSFAYLNKPYFWQTIDVEVFMRSGNEEHDSQVTLVNLVQDAAVSVQCICSFSSAMKIKHSLLSCYSLQPRNTNLMKYLQKLKFRPTFFTGPEPTRQQKYMISKNTEQLSVALWFLRCLCPDSCCLTSAFLQHPSPAVCPFHKG